MTAVVLPLIVAAGTLFLLVAVSEVAERVRPVRRAARHPLVFGLALGVFATSWTLFGSVGQAEAKGFTFLAIYLGPTLSCLAIPLLWYPLARAVRRLRLGSVADLLSYRYDSGLVGAVVTLYLLAGLLPYVALQTRSVADGAAFLAGGEAPVWLGPAYAALIGIFALVLGARYVQPRRQQAGLVVTLAVEAVLKAVALLAVGAMVVWTAFGGPAGLLDWLADHGEALADLQAPLSGSEFPALAIMAAMAAFLLPRQFHVAFVERPDDRSLWHAQWTLPLYLLLLNLPVPLLLWGGRILAPELAPDLYVLGAAGPLRLLSFVGGIAASSGMILVGSIALSGMVVNHLVVPLRSPSGLSPRTISMARRAVIAGTVLAGFVAHLVIPRFGTLVDLGLISFAAVFQLTPGVLAGLFWPRATRVGFLVGLTVGVGTFACCYLVGEQVVPGEHVRAVAVWGSLAANVGGLVLGSLLTDPRPREREAAMALRDKVPARAFAALPVPRLEERLVTLLGSDGARDELATALRDLDLQPDEDRPVALRQLAERVQRDLAGLVGPLAARVALGQAPIRPDEAVAALSAELKFREDRGLVMLSGDPVEAVRQNLVRVLDDLPVGVCAAGGSGLVSVWNDSLSALTGVPAERALASRLHDLPEPWGPELARSWEGGGFEREFQVEEAGRRRILRVTRAPLGEADDAGVALVVQDLTERRQLRLEAEHQDRLAGIGRLAAGVAHEIRNPLTGMLMVAQNLRREEEPEDLEERLGLIVEEGRRIEDIVSALLGYTRSGEHSVPESLRLSELAAQAVTLIRLGQEARGLSWRVEVPPDLTVRAHRGPLTQVLVNLLANARDASPERGTVCVRGAHTADGMVLDVVDEGPGVPPDVVSRVFEPFFTTKAPGEGTGLGLAISHRVVHDHGGTLQYDRVGATTRFRITLPEQAPPGTPAGPAGLQRSSPGEVS